MRGIIRELRETDGVDMTIVDMEAGLEGLKRGTPGPADALLAVAEPYYRSLDTSIAVAELAKELGIPLVGVVANKVHDDKDEELIRKVFEPRGLDILAVVPYDRSVSVADRTPAAVIDVDPDAPVVKAVEKLADTLDQYERETAAVSRSG